MVELHHYTLIWSLNYLLNEDNHVCLRPRHRIIISQSFILRKIHSKTLQTRARQVVKRLVLSMLSSWSSRLCQTLVNIEFTTSVKRSHLAQHTITFWQEAFGQSKSVFVMHGSCRYAHEVICRSYWHIRQRNRSSKKQTCNLSARDHISTLMKSFTGHLSISGKETKALRNKHTTSEVRMRWAKTCV